MLVALPSLFVLVSMAFSNIRPPPNSEFALPLHRLYDNTTDYLMYVKAKNLILFPLRSRFHLKFNGTFKMIYNFHSYSKKPSITDDSVISPLFSQDIMNILIGDKQTRNWTDEVI